MAMKQFHLFLSDELRGHIDTWRKRQGWPVPSAAEAIRELVRRQIEKDLGVEIPREEK